MKILEINKFYYIKGGSERHFFGVMELLRQKGHRIIPFSMNHERNIQSEYSGYFVDYIDLDKFSVKSIIKYFWNHQAVKNLNKLIEKEKPDVAHLHNISHQLSPAIINVLKRKNIPIIQTLHDYKLICPNYMLFSNGKICEKCKGGMYFNCTINCCVKDSYSKSLLASLEAYLHNKILKTYNKVDFFIAPSNFMKDKCLEFGMPENKIQVINNFVESDVYEKKKIKNYLFYFGRLSPEKGLLDLVESFIDFSRIKPANQSQAELSLKIAGEGGMKQVLVDKILEENSNNIELLGYKTGKELKDLILEAKAIIIPSLWHENMPYSMLEAMSMSKVVIASDLGGMKEIIKHGKNGFLFSDKKELFNILSSLDSYNLDEIGRNARENAKTLNSYEYYRKFNEILNNLV